MWSFEKKKITIYGALLLEIVVIVGCIILSFGNKTVYSLPQESLTLIPGVYEIGITYETDAEQVVVVKDETLGYRQLYQNAVSLRPVGKAASTTYQILLLEKTDNFRVEIIQADGSWLEVSDFYIMHMRKEYHILALMLGVLFLIVDLLLYVKLVDENYFTKERKQIIFGVLVIGMLSSMYYFVDYTHLGDDTAFHLSRIEGIYREWKLGNFPARLQSFWMNGKGYPVSIMYGDVFLWIPAFLRWIGLDLITSYNCYVILNNFATAIISYVSFKNIFQDRKIGLFCSAVYTLALYRLFNICVRGAVGEYTAMMFWPLICWGLTMSLSEDEEKVKSKQAVFLLAFGYMGVLYSHILSMELAVFFSLVVCLICYKRFFRKSTLITFGKAAILAILLSAWFLVPLLDYMVNMKMQVFENGKPIQQLGLYVLQIFGIFPWSGSNSYMYADGMKNVKAYGIGSSLIIIYVWYLYDAFKVRSVEGKERVWTRISGGIATLSMCMSLSLFPWDKLCETFPALKAPIYSIQFPYRFLSIATIALVFLGGCKLSMLKKMKAENYWLYSAGVILAFTILGSAFFVDDNLQNKGWSDLREIESMGSSQLGFGEYLPLGATTQIWDGVIQSSDEGVIVSEYTKQGTHVEMMCENQGKGVSSVTCDLIYYIGYKAWDFETGEELSISPTENFLLQIELPQKYKGKVIVEFTGKVLWKVFDWISIGVWIGTIVAFWRCRHIKRKPTYLG